MNIIKYLISIALIFTLPVFIEAKKTIKTRLIPEITTKYKVCIVIPAYNEEDRIRPTLKAYIEFFKSKKSLSTDFLVVANNCKDKTAQICKNLQREHKNLHLLDLPQGGKGYAVREGFKHALKKEYDLIGFVDADMATKPLYFYELITKIEGCDGVIASRYAKGAQVSPKRPLLRKIGGKIYNFVLRHQFHMPFKDTQCGAKIFTKATVQDIVPYMQEKGWAFDLEVLYLCTLFNRKILETPTTWSDIPGSHLDIGASRKEFTTALYRIKTAHKDLAKEKIEQKNHYGQRKVCAKAFTRVATFCKTA